jgi:D-aminopeptidase
MARTTGSPAALSLQELAGTLLSLSALGTLAANVLARGVYEAKALPFPGALPDWKSRFGAKFGPKFGL